MTGYDSERVAALRLLPLAADEKGFGGPLHRTPTTPARLAAERAHTGDGWLSTPRAVLRDSALRHNVDGMAAYCAQRDISLYPHSKTTMAPQLVARQLDAGASGITVATLAQARLFRSFGVRRILVANQVVDEAALAWLARQLTDEPDVTITCYADSVAGVDLMQGRLARFGSGRPLPVLVERGHANGRTGARTREQARAVADAITRSSQLSLAGVAGYEGSIVATSVPQTRGTAEAFCEELGALTSELLDRNQFAETPVVSAGGSAYFDVVADTLAGNPAWRLVLRSGCYITHDHGLYHSISPAGRTASDLDLQPALEVRAPVLSRPELGLVVLGAGRRDVSSDAGVPLLLAGWRGADTVDVTGARVDRFFDQHLVVAVPDSSDVSPGDEVTLGISHPCTTFDKWRWLPVVDDDDVIVDVVRTFF